jgi:uncharacterized membrane protein YhhN
MAENLPPKIMVFSVARKLLPKIVFTFVVHKNRQNQQHFWWKPSKIDLFLAKYFQQPITVESKLILIVFTLFMAASGHQKSLDFL